MNSFTRQITRRETRPRSNFGTYELAHLSCGHTAHNIAPELAECECATCQREQSDLALLPALVAQSVHSRYRPQFGGTISFYARDASSPSGVLLCGTVMASKAIESAITRLDSRKSPLSPTEGLSR